MMKIGLYVAGIAFAVNILGLITRLLTEGNYPVTKPMPAGWTIYALSTFGVVGIGIVMIAIGAVIDLRHH